MTYFVFVHLFNDRSGSPKVLSQVIKALSAEGHSIEVLTSDHTDGFLDGLPGCRRTIFYRRTENKFITLFLYIWSQIFLFFYCLRYWRKDVSFYVNTMMPFGAAVAARLLGKPIIYHVHETSIKPRSLKMFLRLIIRLTASKVIFVSKYLREVENFSGMHQCVVYNALERISDSDPRSEKYFNVLMVCSLKHYKGVPEFLILADLLSFRKDITFTLVLNADQVEIDQSPLLKYTPENVKVFSRQANVHEFYVKASLLLNLSRPDEWVETFGLTVLEGMGHGLPVIAPPVGGPAEIIAHGKNGYLISPYQSERISAAIQNIADDSELYSRLSQCALRRAGEFSVEEFNKNIAKAVVI
ncbi:putative poly(glycerol-phosphate) alpha-glucosyltransferase [compost metagenome]